MKTWKQIKRNKFMTWNYRVFQNDAGEVGIVEVYYDKDGKPIARTEGFMNPYGETLMELRTDIEWMLVALEKPVLTSKDFPNEGE
jgi:hypothetical protein